MVAQSELQDVRVVHTIIFTCDVLSTGETWKTGDINHINEAGCVIRYMRSSTQPCRYIFSSWPHSDLGSAVKHLGHFGSSR